MDAERRIAALEAELAAKDARIAEQDARLAELSAQVAALAERLNRNSGNSNEPPSSDPPSVRAERSGKGASGGKRGGQPGHRGSQRALLPAEQVDEFVNVFPPQCENCWTKLPETSDPAVQPQRVQTMELPKFKPHTTEFRVHPDVGAVRRARPAHIPLPAWRGQQLARPPDRGMAPR